MNDLSSQMQTPNQFALTPQQLALHDALAVKGENLASIYYGAIYVLTLHANPERFSQSAQSIRELLQKLWLEYDPTLKQKDMGLKEKVTGLELVWLKLRRKNGEIIRVSQIAMAELEIFCSNLDALFEWNNRYNPRQREQASRTISRMDPMIGKLPPVILDLRIQEFRTLSDYFQAIAHHNRRPASDAEFRSYVEALEMFLLDRLRPRAGDNFSEIERLIQEGESHA
jgi:hypothetical protein